MSVVGGNLLQQCSLACLCLDDDAAEIELEGLMDEGGRGVGGGRTRQQLGRLLGSFTGQVKLVKLACARVEINSAM